MFVLLALVVLGGVGAFLLLNTPQETSNGQAPSQVTTEAPDDDAVTETARPETTGGISAAPEYMASPTTAPAGATAAPAGWVSAVGDSVMLGAVDTLLQEVPNLGILDAQGSRQPPSAIEILRQRGAAGQLGDSVVFHIGNNGPFTAEQFDEMMRVLSGTRKVLVVNLTVPPDVEDPIAVPNNAVLADGVRRYPNAVLVDWHAASAGHPEFFEKDGIHLTLQGRQGYADLIASYLEGSKEERGSVALPGPRETTYWGQGGWSGECVGPPSWCAVVTP